MSNGKDMTVHLIAGLIKRSYEPYEPFGGDINVKLDLCNYATKTDLKNVSHVDVSSFALKSNLASLMTDVDKLNIGKLQAVPGVLAKLSNKVANDVITKTQLSTLVSNVHIDTTDIVKKSNMKKMGQILNIKSIK